MTIENEIEMFSAIQRDMLEMFAKKRNDYGQTTEETFVKFGPVSLLIRLHDKLGRLDNLLSGNPERVGESVDDTLLDLANYSIIALLELRKAKMLKADECCKLLR